MARANTDESGLDARDQIIRAAERLFAERSISGVSLREIGREAGQSNVAAVQYHFGDRAGLVRAVLGRHRRDNEIRRHILLDQYEQGQEPTIRALASALAAPLAAKLSDPDGGREYLQIAAEHYILTPLPELVRDEPAGSSMLRWHQQLVAMTTCRPPERAARAAAIRFCLVELRRRAAGLEDADDERLFVCHLIDLVTAMLSTGPSPQTERMLAGQRGAATD